MKKCAMFVCVLLGAATAASGVVANIGPQTKRDEPAPSRPFSQKPVQLAIICFKTGESISGINKICMYNCAGSAAAITVGVAELCPVTINR